MAKIKFNDYLKSRQRQEKIYESDESLLRRAKLKLEVDPMVVSPDYRVQNLEAAENLLDQAEGYPGAEKLRRECSERLREAKDARKEADYQRACLHLSEASEEHEYEKAAGEFANLHGYRDAEKKKACAQRMAKKLNRRFQIRRGITLLVIALLAVLIVRGVRGGYMNYAAARLEGLGRQYESAYNRFRRLGSLLDSEQQAEKYRQLYLRQREAAERKSLPDAHKGDTVSFAGQDWLVLRRRNRKLLLICRAPSSESLFRNVPFNRAGGEVDWADSTLRTYLNQALLKSQFTDAERAAMVEMSYTPAGNEEYGVTGSQTVLNDKMRILDLEELSKYGDVFTSPSVDMWLASPGHDRTAAAYMTRSGTVIPYGDDVTDRSLSACPVITVDLRALAAQEES